MTVFFICLVVGLTREYLARKGTFLRLIKILCIKLFHKKNTKLRIIWKLYCLGKKCSVFKWIVNLGEAGPRLDSCSRPIFNVFVLSRVEARYWKPKIVFRRSMNNTQVVISTRLDGIETVKPQFLVIWYLIHISHGEQT